MARSCDGIEVGAVAVALGQLECEADVLLGGQGGDQVEELEDEADVLAAKQREFSAVEVRDVVLAEGDRAARGRVDSAEQVEQRGLAGARRAQDRHELAAVDGELVDVQRLDLDLAHLVDAANVAHDDEGSARFGGCHGCSLAVVPLTAYVPCSGRP